jgi:uncharacterized protein YkwD
MKRLLPALALLLIASAASAIEPSNEITAANVLREMNGYRAEEGLPPLQLDERIHQAAEDRMRDMEDGQYWSHRAPDGRSPFAWLASHAYDYQSAGENLANGFETARLLVQAWMESRGHRANIMSTDYEDCGIAIIDGSTLGPATGKSIVVMFGRQHEGVTPQVARNRR